jgi:hypothetical protein
VLQALVLMCQGLASMAHVVKRLSKYGTCGQVPHLLLQTVSCTQMVCHYGGCCCTYALCAMVAIE